jgi:TonB family C-terminal domain
MSPQAVALREGKPASLPFMIFGSIIVHGVALLLVIVAPSLFGHPNPEPFGGPSGSGGNVMWVNTGGLGAVGKPAPKPMTQEEPAPPKYIKAMTEKDEVPLPSKTEIVEPAKKKPKDEPKEKVTLNQPERKKDGIFGKGTDTRADSGKSGNLGKGRNGVAAIGIGIGGEGGFGTGTGTPFPFPWYVENVITKIEIAWQKPIILQNERKDYFAVVYFVIDRRGQVSQVKTEESSGMAILDRSCESAIYGAAPFPPLPNQWTEPVLAFRLTFKSTP